MDFTIQPLNILNQHQARCNSLSLAACTIMTLIQYENRLAISQNFTAFLTYPQPSCMHYSMTSIQLTS
jgi:hypothetical protein